MSKWNQECTPHLVADYLTSAYQIDRLTAAEAISTCEPILWKGMAFGSLAGFVADEIASHYSWPEREGFDSDAEDEDQ